jgi:hypothetical protein
VGTVQDANPTIHELDQRAQSLLSINTNTVVLLNLIPASILGILHGSDEIEDDGGNEIAFCMVQR